MKFKLDENIGAAGAEILRVAGHDVATVREQHLEGAPDDFLFDVCVREQRSLVTLDRGFARLLRFSDSREIGIAVLDIGTPQRYGTLLERVRQLCLLLAETELTVPSGFWNLIACECIRRMGELARQEWEIWSVSRALGCSARRWKN